MSVDVCNTMMVLGDIDGYDVFKEYFPNTEDDEGGFKNFDGGFYLTSFSWQAPIEEYFDKVIKALKLPATYICYPDSGDYVCLRVYGNRGGRSKIIYELNIGPEIEKLAPIEYLKTIAANMPVNKAFIEFILEFVSEYSRSNSIITKENSQATITTDGDDDERFPF